MTNNEFKLYLLLAGFNYWKDVYSKQITVTQAIHIFLPPKAAPTHVHYIEWEYKGGNTLLRKASILLTLTECAEHINKRIKEITASGCFCAK